MKIRLWHLFVFVGALIAFAAMSAPASVFLPSHPGRVAYESVEGAIWNARARGVTIGSYRVDQAAWRISPWDVLRGRAVIPVTLSGGDIEGALTLLGNVQGDRRVVAESLTVHGLTVRAAQLPGRTRFIGVDVLFEGGTCARAQGRIETDVLAQSGAGLGWAGPELSGHVSCEVENGVVEMSGSTALEERVDVRIMLRQDGSASWRATVLTTRPETIAALTGLGFSRGAADGLLGYGEDTRWLP